MGLKEKKTHTSSRQIAGWSRNKNTLEKRIPTDSEAREKKGLILALLVPGLMLVSYGGRRAQSSDFETSVQRRSNKTAVAEMALWKIRVSL